MKILGTAMAVFACSGLLALDVAAQTAAPAGPAPQPAGPPPPITAPFAVHMIAQGITGGYQVVAADINHDGKTDVIALGLTADTLNWYENPSWTPHVITTSATTPHMVIMDAADVDGDGIPEVALSYNFNAKPSMYPGGIGILRHDGDPTKPWLLNEIDKVPATHRLKFADIDGSGKKVLVAAPILNAQSPGFPDPDHLATPLLMYRPGEWKREVITEENKGVVHGLLAYDWDGKGRDDVLTAGYSGVNVHSYDKGAWKRVLITPGDLTPWPKGGASDVVVGKMKGKQFFVTIEPFHGNQVVVYMKVSDGTWQRNVIDTTLATGHALTLVDVDGDGIPEIVAGGNASRANLFFYKAADASGQHWNKTLMDNDMAAGSCVAADIKGNHKTNDIVCMDARAPFYLKWYEYTGK